jgi:hypothetical protein
MKNRIIMAISQDQKHFHQRRTKLVSSLMPGTKAHRSERSKDVAKAPKSALKDWKGFGADPRPRVLLVRYPTMPHGAREDTQIRPLFASAHIVAPSTARYKILEVSCLVW